MFSLKTLTRPRLLLAMAAASAAALSAALIGQYGFALHPCHLCLYQRYPYAAISILGLAGAYFARKNSSLNTLITICILLFFIDSGIATYHAGVELGIFPGPSGCTVAQEGEKTLAQLRAEIMNAPLVTCDQAMIHILGLSMAAWNALAAAAFGIASSIAFIKIRKAA